MFQLSIVMFSIIILVGCVTCPPCIRLQNTEHVSSINVFQSIHDINIMKFTPGLIYADVANQVVNHMSHAYTSIFPKNSNSCS